MRSALVTWHVWASSFASVTWHVCTSSFVTFVLHRVARASYIERKKKEARRAMTLNTSKEFTPMSFCIFLFTRNMYLKQKSKRMKRKVSYGVDLSRMSDAISSFFHHLFPKHTWNKRQKIRKIIQILTFFFSLLLTHTWSRKQNASEKYIIPVVTSAEGRIRSVTSFSIFLKQKPEKLENKKSYYTQLQQNSGSDYQLFFLIYFQ